MTPNDVVELLIAIRDLGPDVPRPSNDQMLTWAKKVRPLLEDIGHTP